MSATSIEGPVARQHEHQEDGRKGHDGDAGDSSDEDAAPALGRAALHLGRLRLRLGLGGRAIAFGLGVLVGPPAIGLRGLGGCRFAPRALGLLCGLRLALSPCRFGGGDHLEPLRFLLLRGRLDGRLPVALGRVGLESLLRSGRCRDLRGRQSLAFGLGGCALAFCFGRLGCEAFSFCVGGRRLGSQTFALRVRGRGRLPLAFCFCGCRLGRQPFAFCLGGLIGCALTLRVAASAARRSRSASAASASA